MCNTAWQQKNNLQADISMWLWSLIFQFDLVVKESAGLVNRGIWVETTWTTTTKLYKQYCSGTLSSDFAQDNFKLKGTPSQDTSWPKNVENVQIFPVQASCGCSINIQAT